MKTLHRKTGARRAFGLKSLQPCALQDPPVSVIVRDLSLSGVACEALTGMAAGTRVWLTLPGLAALQAKIIWNDGTIVGCEFSTLLNPAVLQDILARFPA